jgi:hypothetical protein
MNFYLLGEIVGPYYTWFSPMAPEHEGDAPHCSDCGIALGSLTWLPPYRAKIEATVGKLGDWARGPGNSRLVSERFRHAWEERKLIGIEAFTPLERIRVRPARLGKPSPVFYHIQPSIFTATIDFARSTFKPGRPRCDTCRSLYGYKSVNGFRIDEATWTGEDMFRPRGVTGMVIVTERVKQLRDDYDLKNVELTPTEEYSYPPDYTASTDA